jgi:hypothetical protein
MDKEFPSSHRHNCRRPAAGIRAFRETPWRAGRSYRQVETNPLVRDTDYRSTENRCEPTFTKPLRQAEPQHRGRAISYEFVRGITFPPPAQAQLAEYLSLSHRRRAVSRVASDWHCDSRCVHPWAIRKRRRRRELSGGYHPSLE